jgi:disease resistance protein
MAEAAAKKKCTRRGCLKEFTDEGNTEGCCVYHPGKPKFHDTKKGWDCCNKLAYDWDEFQKIPGCQTGLHTDQKEETEFWKSQTVNNAKAGLDKAPNPDAPVPKSIDSFNKEQEEKKKIEQQQQAPVEKKLFVTADGKHKCTNKGCNKEYQADSNTETSCNYHPGAPVSYLLTARFSMMLRRSGLVAIKKLMIGMNS